MSRLDATTLRIHAAIASVKEDCRTDYLFPTKVAAAAVGCTPNKFADWWRRSWHKNFELYIACPAEFATEMMALFAAAEIERQRREQLHHASRRTLNDH